LTGKTDSLEKITVKKVPASLNKLLQSEKDLKKMNVELKKVLKKVKTLEKENSKLQKKLDNKWYFNNKFFYLIVCVNYI